jgi:hypothetical protein
MEWSEQGMRLSPFDSWAEAAFDAQAMSHLLRGRYEEFCLAGLQVRSSQSGTQHHLCAVGRRTRQTGTVGRSDGRRRSSARASPGLSLQPPVCWCELCASARGGFLAARCGTPDCQSSPANCRDVFSLASDAPLSFEFGASTSGSECYLALKRRESTSR